MNHRCARGAGTRHRANVAGIDAADAYHRHLDRVDDLAQTVRSNPFPRYILAGRSEDGTTADVVCAGGYRVLSLLRIIGRPANQERGGRNPSRSGQRHVAGAEVNAIGACREGDVESIVDEKQSVELAGQPAQLDCLFEELTRACVFISQLHDRRARFERLANYVVQRARTGQLRVSDDNEADIERSIHASLTPAGRQAGGISHSNPPSRLRIRVGRARPLRLDSHLPFRTIVLDQ